MDIPGQRGLVRAARPADLEKWLPLWHGYNAFYGREGPTALPASVTTDRWEAFMSPTKQVWSLVAERAGALIGLANYMFHESTTSIAPACYLQDLFVLPDERRGGTGRALIEGVASRASEAGCASVYWQTHQDNRTARLLYDRIASQSEFLIYRLMLDR